MQTGLKKYLQIGGIVFLATGLSLSGENAAPSRPDKVADSAVSITDIDGRNLKPLQMESSTGTVLFFVTHDCPISNAYSPELARLRNEYIKKGFRLMLVYVDPDVSSEEIEKHREDYNLRGYTAIRDSKQILVKQTGAKVTPEAVVILPNGSIAYRGRIDNMYPALGKRRRTITKHELKDALNAILDDRPIQVSRTKAIGCFIPNR